MVPVRKRRPQLVVGVAQRVCAVRGSSAGLEQAFALVAGLIAAGGLSGPCGG